jgi:hypothetical protein
MLGTIRDRDRGAWSVHQRRVFLAVRPATSARAGTVDDLGAAKALDAIGVSADWPAAFATIQRVNRWIGFERIDSIEHGDAPSSRWTENQLRGLARPPEKPPAVKSMLWFRVD